MTPGTVLPRLDRWFDQFTMDFSPPWLGTVSRWLSLVASTRRIWKRDPDGYICDLDACLAQAEGTWSACETECLKDFGSGAIEDKKFGWWPTLKLVYCELTCAQTNDSDVKRCRARYDCNDGCCASPEVCCNNQCCPGG
jgi:hypothetical protein